MDEAIRLEWRAPAVAPTAADLERARRELSAAIAFVARSNASIIVANLVGLEEAIRDLGPQAVREDVALVIQPREDGGGIDVRVSHG